MSKLTFSPAERLSELVNLIRAWNTDRNEQDRASYSSREKPAGKMAVLLLDSWENWLGALKEHGEKLPKVEKKSLVDVFDKLLKTGDNATWSNRHALNDLVRAVKGRDVVARQDEALQETLLKIGCWPELSSPGKAPDSLKPYGPYASQINAATENSQASVLRTLLDWEGSGDASEPLLQSRQTGTSLPTGFHQNHQTGWAWAVRNTSPECLDIWLQAGADPNAVDKLGRPVMAYVHKPASLALLLEAGADPLNPGLPIEERRRNLSALWEGWRMPLYWANGQQREDREWSQGLDYLRGRLALWSDEDIRRATDGMLLSAYLETKRPAMSQTNTWLVDLAKELGRVSSLDPSQETMVRGRSWSFAGALAREWLLADAFIGSAPRLPQVNPDKELEPGVKERTLARLVSLSDDEKTAQATLAKLGAANVSGALVVMMEEASAVNSYWKDKSLLVRRTRQVLGHAGRMGQPWVDAMVPVVNAVFKTLRGDWECSADRPIFKMNETVFFLQWALKNQDKLPVRAQMRWFIKGLGAYQPKDEPVIETTPFREALISAAQKDPEFLTDPSLKNELRLAFSRQAGLEKAIRSAVAQEALEEALPKPSSAPIKKPRF